MTTQSQFLQTIDRPAMSTNQILFGLALVLVLAVGSQLLARPLRAPALVMLLPAGFVAGVATDDVHPDKLLGSLYQPFVSIAVGVILFEAGLRLSIAADGRPPSGVGRHSDRSRRRRLTRDRRRAEGRGCVRRRPRRQESVSDGSAGFLPPHSPLWMDRRRSGQRRYRLSAPPASASNCSATEPIGAKLP